MTILTSLNPKLAYVSSQIIALLESGFAGAFCVKVKANIARRAPGNELGSRSRGTSARSQHCAHERMPLDCACLTQTLRVKCITREWTESALTSVQVTPAAGSATRLAEVVAYSSNDCNAWLNAAIHGMIVEQGITLSVRYVGYGQWERVIGHCIRRSTSKPAVSHGSIVLAETVVRFRARRKIT